MSLRVIATTPYWHLNGVNTVTASLVRGLHARAVGAEVLLTDATPRGFSPLPPPPDVPMRQLRCNGRIRAHLQSLAQELERCAPCVYLPGYDYRHSGVAPVLADGVIIVGVVHSDDPLHYDHVRRLGRYWNAIVCVSRAIERRVRQEHPELADRTLTIHNGVDLPTSSSVPSGSTTGRLELVWAGRVAQKQKRALDLVDLLDRIHELGTPARLTIIGDGPALAELRTRTSAHVASGRVRILGVLPNEEVLAHFTRADVFILTSDFEGLPISMLEAMARRCIPIVTDIPSGIPEVVKSRQNGCILPVGDMSAFAREIDRLAREPAARAALSDAARNTILHEGFNTPQMAGAYLELFQRLQVEVEAGRFRRPRGEIQLPWKPSLRDRISLAIRTILPRRKAG